jgi:hypothetical protein
MMGCASQAAASGFILTYQGTVDFGVDDTNIFGLGAGAFLGGQAITQSFKVDYAGGGNHDISGDPSYFRSSIGGPGFITSAVTINGVTTSIGSDTGIDDRTDEHLNPTFCAVCKSSFGVFTGDESFVNLDGFLESWSRSGGDFGKSFDYHPSLGLGPPVFGPADNMELYGSFIIDHSLFNQREGVSVFDDTTYANFSVDSYSITTFGGAPEPAAWGLMLLGFGAAGAMLRRRPRAALA